jgi:ABC-type uncharacterized transport system ATPase subunit
VSTTSTQVPTIAADGITKRFGSLVANESVSIQAYAGRVLAIVGENGAGKSTLMNVLSGLLQPDGGRIRMDGRDVRFHSPRDAIRAGIGMVHQHFMLIPVFSVAENVVLGQEPNSTFLFDARAANRRVAELSDQYGLKLNPRDWVSNLPVGIQQRVEIVKLLYRGSRILIFDEPTAVLTPQETNELFVVLRDLAAQGKTIIFITHKLHEVIAISDHITVLRHGKVVGDLETVNSSPEEITRYMIGRDLMPSVRRDAPRLGEPVVEMKNVRCQSDRHIEALKGVSLEVQAGEVLGIAGVEGNGQSELVEVLTGLRRVTDGSITMRDGGSVEITENPLLARDYFASARQAWAVAAAAVVATGIFIPVVKVGSNPDNIPERSLGLAAAFGAAALLLLILTLLKRFREQAVVGAAVVFAAIVGMTASATFGSSLGIKSVIVAGWVVMLVGGFMALMAPWIKPGRVFSVRTRGPALTISNRNPKWIRSLGVGFIPEDRRERGLVLPYSVAQNLILGIQSKAPFSGLGALNFEIVLENARRLVPVFDIRPRRADVQVRTLSGGNQQKVVLAREFSQDPILLIAAQPTRGLDVGAAQFVHQSLVEKRDQGVAVLLVSAELEEIMTLSDRIAVIYEGQIMGIFAAGTVDEERLGLLMTGGERKTAEQAIDLSALGLDASAGSAPPA